MIDRVHFENFKSLKDVTLDLERLTVLVGPNGCGKTSVLEGIRLLSSAGVARAGEAQHSFNRFASIFRGPFAPARLASPGRPTTLKFAMREHNGDELKLGVYVPAGDEPESDELWFALSIDGPEGPLEVKVPLKGNRNRDVLKHPRLHRFTSVAYLHLDAAAMTETSIPAGVHPRVAADGSQLPSVLAWMKGAAEDQLAEVVADLRRVVPGVKRIRTLRQSVSTEEMERLTIDGQPVWRPVNKAVLGDRFEIEFDNGISIPADLLSEGTVLALGLLTVLHEPERPRLILLDDIDRGLHIEAQAKLVQVLRDLLAANPDLQIVCTTHSPYLLDRFQPEEVRMLALDAHRHTQALPLKRHPEFEKWKFGTQTGELWAALGSAWVTPTEGQGK